MEKTFSLKDDLFNRETVMELSHSIKCVHETFDADSYTEKCLSGFDSRELKERMSYMCELLKTELPSDFYKATDIMLKACEKTKASERFVYGSFCEYIEKYGCSDEYLNHSLKMLGEYTKVFSAEFAIRAFINKFPKDTFKQMVIWSTSVDVDQRRLASEGMRPKLPWGKSIDFDPALAMEPLNNLYFDSERYVTRSVANHLNDLSKIQPDLVISTLIKWRDSKKQNDKEMTYIINHSTRTLIKKCHSGALELQGYNPESKLEVKDFHVNTPKVHIGDSLEFEFEITALEDANLMIDYKVDYPMANGKRGTKVFKIKKASLLKNENLKINKKHQFRVMTTKKLYDGEHKVSLQINGKTFDEGSFYLQV